ncbi:MAG: DUF106 domain-containing protein, partial [Candidatus Altiarchaeales archaeon]|nr:DUF106 domain-containing protein [Candidatus Altiarchaeales archaeon]
MIELTPEGQTVALVAVGLATMSTFVRSAVLDKEKLAQQKQEIKQHQEKLKQAQKNKDTKGMQKSQEALMQVMGEQMKHSFKPMIYTIIPFILVFGWLRDNFG